MEEQKEEEEKKRPVRALNPSPLRRDADTFPVFFHSRVFPPHRCFCIVAPSSSLKRCSAQEALPLRSTAALSAPAPVILAPDSRSFVDYRACLSLAVGLPSTSFSCRGRSPNIILVYLPTVCHCARADLSGRAGGVENIHRRMTDKDTRGKDGLLMDNRDARRRHTLRGAPIHVNTHKHAHGKKNKKKTDGRGRTRRRKKKPKISPTQKAIPYFHGFGGTLPCSGSVGRVGGAHAHRDRRRSDSQTEKTSSNVARVSGRSELDVPEGALGTAGPLQPLLPPASPTSAHFR